MLVVTSPKHLKADSYLRLKEAQKTANNCKCYYKEVVKMNLFGKTCLATLIVTWISILTMSN
jgi:hypothetical protein